MSQFAITIHVQTDDEDAVDLKQAARLAGDRIEEYDTAIQVTDTHVDPIVDDEDEYNCPICDAPPFDPECKCQSL